MKYVLALHIIFVVTWFAGLFYLVRLFIYHTEANEKKEPDRTILINHFLQAEKRLWFGITWPSAILTFVFGIWLMLEWYSNHIPLWLWIKLFFVLQLALYHLGCGLIYNSLKHGKMKFSSMKLRIWNEVATVYLFAIVFLVVLKDSMSWVHGLTGLLIFSGLLLLAIRIYKNVRKAKR